MSKVQLRRPFFVINPKSYLYGDKILELAKYADQLAAKYDFDVLFTAQHADLRLISENTSKLIVIAQHMDGIKAGKGMGHILPEGCIAAGAKGSFLNHAEHPMTMHELALAMHRLDELELLTIVCADSVEEAKAIAKLNPNVMVCEPTSLIGTGQVSDANYMKSTNEAVKSVSPTTQVLQAAGISTGQNVYDAIVIGADGTGGTSGIVAADDPFKTLDEMFEALDKARTDIKE
ncbi:triose-phosphate isomerase [Anaerorhabdus furcosa]|uniref:Triosephosphate isomerase n=1 Tax=Anaerorhabdus furcosa TaxID=118967 RepID=A0A1T4P1A9_9FIRM|nr:triose-phosphate isomerase [Anaerorhabdus furcosa]SJZ85315.1 triosephosphate isomerase [Anaerorhabdus furcosa]